MRIHFALILALPLNLWAQGCVEEKLTLLNEFIPLSFDDRISTGSDQVTPVKKKIEDYIIANPGNMITDINVTSIATKAPLKNSKYKDAFNDERNKKLAFERAEFADKGLKEIVAARSDLAAVTFSTDSYLTGPDFSPIDLNTRFVTKLSPDYEKKVRELFEQNKIAYTEDALIKTPEELLGEKRFSNLYQVKYKPYQGFRVLISGHKKELLKCTEVSKKSKQVPRAKAQ